MIGISYLEIENIFDIKLQSSWVVTLRNSITDSLVQGQTWAIIEDFIARLIPHISLGPKEVK